MKCDCYKEAIAKIKEMNPEYKDVYAPLELLSGRLYLNFTGVKEVKGKRKEVNVPLLLTKCPFCGMVQTDPINFYEFNHFAYYALIGAKSVDEAIRFYKEQVADINDSRNMPDVITKEEAAAKFNNHIRTENVKTFDELTRGEGPVIILIDGALT